MLQGKNGLANGMKSGTGTWNKKYTLRDIEEMKLEYEFTFGGLHYYKKDEYRYLFQPRRRGKEKAYTLKIMYRKR